MNSSQFAINLNCDTLNIKCKTFAQIEYKSSYYYDKADEYWNRFRFKFHVFEQILMSDFRCLECRNNNVANDNYNLLNHICHLNCAFALDVFTIQCSCIVSIFHGIPFNIHRKSETPNITCTMYTLHMPLLKWDNNGQWATDNEWEIAMKTII